MKIKRRCKRCGTIIKKETHRGLRKEYPFYCPCCNENVYRFETTKLKPSEQLILTVIQDSR